MSDPTYDRAQINANPEWTLAFTLSEILNDNAPIGWSTYRGAARCLLDAGYQPAPPVASDAERLEFAATLREAARSARTAAQRCPDHDLHKTAHFEAACLVGAAALDVGDGAALIAAERQRQIDTKGWTPEHDDTHDKGELGVAARAYVRCSEEQINGWSGIPPNWPWELASWKPSDDPIRNLVKAGALIAAEIDRLQRKARG